MKKPSTGSLSGSIARSIGLLLSISLIVFTSVSLPIWSIYLGWEGLVSVYWWFLGTGVYTSYVEGPLSTLGLIRPPNLLRPDPYWIVQATLWSFVPLVVGILTINALLPMKKRIINASGFVPARLKGSHDLTGFVSDRLSSPGDPGVSVWLIADPRINAFALSGPLGGNAIVISTGILEQLPQEVIQWIVAHEYAHIIHNDTRSTALWLVTLRSVNRLNWLKVHTTNLLLRVIHKIPVLKLLTTPFLLVLNVLTFCSSLGLKLGCWTFLLFDRWGSRRMELAADRFAAAVCGSRPGIVFFSSLTGVFENRFGSVFATHPTHRQRVAALEAYEKKTAVA